MRFLKKNVPQNYERQFAEEEPSMRYYKMKLYGVKNKKKKLDDYLRTPKKRKQLTAREKRDLKLFDIPTEEQKWDQ